MVSVPVFLINLDRSPERLAHMREQLTQLQVPFERIAAVDGASGSADVARHQRPSRWHRPLSPGEIGCFASHYRLWQRIVDEGIAVAVILEDDIELGPDFAEAVAALASGRLDFVRLAKIRRARGPVLHTIGGFDVIEDFAFSKLSGTGAYMIGREGARKLLAQADIWALPVDQYIDRAWIHGVRTLELAAPPVEQTTRFGSEVNAFPIGGDRPGRSRTLRELHRAVMWLRHTAHLVAVVLPDHLHRRLFGAVRPTRPPGLQPSQS